MAPPPDGVSRRQWIRGAEPMMAPGGEWTVCGELIKRAHVGGSMQQNRER